MSKKKDILTVAPFLADDFEEAGDINFDAFQYQQFIKHHKKRLGLFSRYLICKFHDSWIIDIIIRDNIFSVILNDFSTHVFADAIIEKKYLDIDHDKLVFPVQLDFQINTKVTFNEVDDEGNMTEMEPIKLDVYLNEQIISIDNDKVELALKFWKNAQKKKPGQQIILHLTATGINIKEGQDLAWQQIFGSSFDGYYKYFKQEFDTDRYVSDQHICLELIDEYDDNISRTNA